MKVNLDRLSDLLGRRKMTFAFLSKVAGVRRDALKELFETGNGNGRTLKKIAKYFGITTEDLIQ